MKILIVDDELLLAMDLHTALSRAGHDVIGFAPTPDAALTMAAGLRPELALVDINLLGQTEGIDLAEALKARYGTDIIFITAYTDEPVMARARGVEPIAILHKPVDQTALFGTIEQAGRAVSA
jgi:two-component SAPR family response regulator